MATIAPNLPPSSQVAPRNDHEGNGEEDLGNSNIALSDLEKASCYDELPAIGDTNAYLVEFDGANDPSNPKSWTENRRWAITVSMGLMVFTVTFASSIFSVNIGYVQQNFDVDLVTATLGVSLFVLVCRNFDVFRPVW